MLFTGRKWLLNGVECDAAALARWLDEVEVDLVFDMPIGASHVFKGRGKCTRIA